MAESKDKKNSNTQDSFADDLDSMLNLDETNEQQLELIDDDDAIDRLLMDDAFGEDSEDSNAEPAELDDIDQLIAEEVEKDDSFDFDEFGDDADDFFADFQINEKAEDAIDEDTVSPPDKVEVADNIELPEAETVAGADEPDYDESAMSAAETESETDVIDDQLEDMTEIDEFSEDSDLSGSDDFLMADFDIAPEDEIETEFESEQGNVEQAVSDVDDLEVTQPVSEEQPDADDLLEEVSQSVSETEEIEEAEEVVLDESPEQEPQVQAASSDSEQAALIAELTAQLAGLNTQFDDLKSQQSMLKQQLLAKSNQDELQGCVEDVETLKTEQRKIKRNFDAISNNKPVAAYVANAIAVIALIVGSGLGAQGYIAKKQLEEVAEYLGKLQEQVNAPRAVDTAEAAEKEMLRKRLDQLAQASSINASQLAELTQALQGEGDDASGAMGRKFDELNGQDMEMGAAIEALQNKVADLEKRKVPETKKAEAKKPVVVQENWVVNLVAYKQDWYAKRKAEEFAGKGVQAKVSRVESKGEIWYRLSVDGFKSQYDAAAYAARVKKTLNLDSVWLAKVKK